MNRRHKVTYFRWRLIKAPSKSDRLDSEFQEGTNLCSNFWIDCFILGGNSPLAYPGYSIGILSWEIRLEFASGTSPPKAFADSPRRRASSVEGFMFFRWPPSQRSQKNSKVKTLLDFKKFRKSSLWAASDPINFVFKSNSLFSQLSCLQFVQHWVMCDLADTSQSIATLSIGQITERLLAFGPATDSTGVNLSN